VNSYSQFRGATCLHLKVIADQEERNLKLKAAHFSATSITVYQSIWCYVPVYTYFNHRRNNYKSFAMLLQQTICTFHLVRGFTLSFRKIHTEFLHYHVVKILFDLFDHKIYGWLIVPIKYVVPGANLKSRLSQKSHAEAWQTTTRPSVGFSIMANFSSYDMLLFGRPRDW